MRERINLILKRLRSVKFTRQMFVVSLILGLLTLVAYMSWGGSQTLEFEDERSDVIYQGEPREVIVPRLDENFTTGSNIPTFNPPAGIASGFEGTFELPTDAPEISGTGTFPTLPGTLPTLPTGNQPIPTGGPSPPTLPTINNPSDEPITTNPEGPNNPQERPNKARNLPNVSRYEFIPQVNLGFFDQILSKFNLSFQNLLFLFIMLGVIYYPLVGVNNILSQLKKTDEEEESIFFKPTISEEELRRYEARQKRLKSFASHIEELVQRTEYRKKTMKPQELIVITYHELDEAFNDFAKLKRTRDLTPLEHSKLDFETGEINNNSLIEIVELFYQARFGKKDLEGKQIETLLFNLGSLVNQETIKERDEQISRWRLFR